MAINEVLLKDEMKTNIVNEEDTKDIINKVLTILSSAISKSLGPYGSTTIIKDIYNIDNKITKDGYSILNKISFKGELQGTILKIVKSISKSLVEEVGDGSTSSIVIAESLYKTLENFFNYEKSVARKDVLDFLNKLSKIIEEEVLKESIELKDVEQLKKIASISNNNDEEIGSLVANIYKDLDFSGFINLELSPNENTFHKLTNGVEIERGYTNFIFANQKDKVTCEFEKPRFVLCNGELGEEDIFFVAELLSLTAASENPLVLIAREFSPEVNAIINNNKAKFKNKLPIVAIEYNLSSLQKHEEFLDLAIYLNATMYDKYNGEVLTKQDAGNFYMNRLGMANKITVNEKRTLIVEGHFDSKEIEDRLKIIDKSEEELNEKANVADVTVEKYNLEKRRSQLKGKIATLYIGGSSSLEKRTRKDLVEDSIFACKSAIKYGYVIGGNLIIPYILYTKGDEIIDRLIKDESIFIGLDSYDEKSGINTNKKSEVIKQLVEDIKDSFLYSFYKVIMNKYDNKEKALEIINNCISNNKLSIFNLRTNEYEDITKTNVINSAKTDIEIMNSVFSIIGLLASSNQMLAIEDIYDF